MASFVELIDARNRGELLLIDGGYCHWHLRKDGQITIREIISTRPGAGTEILDMLMQVPGVVCVVARCPQRLASNGWYARRGFDLVCQETTRSNNVVNVWRLSL